MTVVTFPGHKWYRCPAECEGCYICIGGLAACVTCNGAESSLPTECPGYGMTAEDSDAVSAGIANFRGGQWIEEDAAKVRRKR